jgi:hypothetical protein
MAKEQRGMNGSGVVSRDTAIPCRGFVSRVLLGYFSSQRYVLYLDLSYCLKTNDNDESILPLA